MVLKSADGIQAKCHNDHLQSSTMSSNPMDRHKGYTRSDSSEYDRRSSTISQDGSEFDRRSSTISQDGSDSEEEDDDEGEEEEEEEEPNVIQVDLGVSPLRPSRDRSSFRE